MSKYIDADKLIAEIDSILSSCTKQTHTGVFNTCTHIKGLITSLQQEQPDNMIQWTGNNLKEVIDFTGKSQRFGEWFKSWEEYENYVHTHNDVLKLFCEDGSHYEVPVGAWIVKTPDGYNVPSIARFIRAKGIDGIVFHAHCNHWIETNEKQLATVLKKFPEGTEVEILIFAKKEE